MCTAATYQTKDFYMGRTLDYEFSYGEEIAVMPRNYPHCTFDYDGETGAALCDHRYGTYGGRISACIMMRSMKKVLVWLG